MSPENAEKIINEFFSSLDSQLVPIPILQQNTPMEFTQCVSIRKARHWEDLLAGDRCKGFYEDDNGQPTSVQVEITEPLFTDDYHKARSLNKTWLVANPKTTHKGRPDFYFLIPDEG